MDEVRKTSTLTQIHDTLIELDKLSQENLQLTDQIGEAHPTTQIRTLEAKPEKQEPQPNKITIIESIDNTINQITAKQDTIHEQLTKILNWTK